MNRKNRNLLFISHADKDKRIVSKFVDLLYDIGLTKNDMFCSSRTDLDISIGENIYDYLRDILDSDNIIAIFMLSDNYYKSAACLNEMGAVWLKQNKYYTFLLPEFEFKSIKGAINPNVRGIRLDNDNESLKGDLTNFKERIENDFSIDIAKRIGINRWENLRDQFIGYLSNYSDNTIINLANHRGYCIGEENYGGCSVYYDKITNIIKTTFDFTKTGAEVCSVVFFVGKINALSKYQNNNCLSFKLKADREWNITVELRLKNQDAQYTIQVSEGWLDYSIHLKDFHGAEDNWKELTEIKFLAYSNDITTETIQIKDIVLK